MMKKILLSMAMTAASVSFISCQKDTEAPVRKDSSAVMTLSARIDDVFTRTTLVNGGNVNWNDGDAITVNGVRFVATPVEGDSTRASFMQADNQPSPKAPYYAFFPFGIQTEENCGTLPDEQIYTEGRLDNVPMYGYCKDNNDVLNFKNICGVLAVKVEPGEIDQVAAIRVSSTDEAVSGDFTVVGDSAVLTDDAKSYLGTVVLTCERPVTIDAEKVFYIAIPAQKYTDINIEISSDGDTYTQGMLTRSAKNITVERGRIYTVVFKADAPTANCYIAAPKDSTFTIKAVKGNTSELVGCVKSVKVLWASFGTNIAPQGRELVDTVSYSRGFITYKIKGESEGNAVIAAYDGEGGSGSVLWSWHIWITDSPEEQTYKSNAGIMMDRNLGATDTIKGSVAALGLLYQWGRKDPFLGPQKIDSSARAASTNEFVWKTEIAPKTSSFAVAYPTRFIKSSFGSWAIGFDAVWTSDKSVYDPCPVGWRVPDGGRLGVWDRAASGNPPGFDDEKRGVQCSDDIRKYFTEKPSCWYPAAGFIHSETGMLSDVGNKGRCWSCTKVFLDPFSAYGFDFEKEGANSNEVVSAILDLKSIDSRANGQSVRCQKIEEE